MNIEVSDIALNIGFVLQGKYTINKVHYLGNFGIVYFGTELNSDRQIVIKECMPYKLANRDMDGKTVICKSPSCRKSYQAARKSFQDECDTVKKLNELKKPYPGCVLPYVDDFEENNTFYLITERVKGKCLQEYIENGDDYSIRKTMQELVAIVNEVHKKGIVHCDIKPTNILLTENQDVVLIDFGSACRMHKPQDHIAFVSRGFSAPELYHEDKVDQRTDYYSIGALLYYLLTDYQLPDPDDYEDEEEIPGISEFIDISPKLEKAILQTLNREKKNRPRNLFKLQVMLNH